MANGRVNVGGGDYYIGDTIDIENITNKPFVQTKADSHSHSYIGFYNFENFNYFLIYLGQSGSGWPVRLYNPEFNKKSDSIENIRVIRGYSTVAFLDGEGTGQHLKVYNNNAVLMWEIDTSAENKQIGEVEYISEDGRYEVMIRDKYNWKYYSCDETYGNRIEIDQKTKDYYFKHKEYLYKKKAFKGYLEVYKYDRNRNLLKTLKIENTPNFITYAEGTFYSGNNLILIATFRTDETYVYVINDDFKIEKQARSKGNFIGIVGNSFYFKRLNDDYLYVVENGNVQQFKFFSNDNSSAILKNNKIYEVAREDEKIRVYEKFFKILK